MTDLSNAIPYPSNLRACDRIRHSYMIPELERVSADFLMVRHLKPIPHTRSVSLSVPNHMLEPDYINGNSTIHPIPDGYLVLQRCSNYRIVPETQKPDTIRSKNIWIHLDENFEGKWYHELGVELVERISYNPLQKMKITGLEDLRFFEWNQRWWFVAGSNHFERKHKGVDRWGQVLCRLNEEGTDVDYVRPLVYKDSAKVEKNWLPFVQNDTLYLIYGYSPFVILKPDISSGRCHVAHRQIQPVRMDRYRGSGTPIPWKDGWLFTVHEVRVPTNWKFIYNHRFVFMDKQFNITNLSDPFYFHHIGVEYTCGHCLSNDGIRLLMTYSSEDRDAKLIAIMKDTVDNMLRPIEEFQPDEQ